MPVQISMNIDEDTKQRFDILCENVGVTPTHVISTFITHAVLRDGIPFDSIPIDEEMPPKKNKRTLAEVFGCMRGKFKMTDDFDAPLEDFKEYME
jgi:addiction module RelB/DinJ family antitoxin